MKSGGKKSFKRDEDETNMLIKAGKTSGEEALRASKALGLAVTYLEKGWLISESAEGEKKRLKKQTANQPSIKLKKGMILHVKK